ncbi:MAG: hypothetical protein A3G33_08470 [Omnitrophica bacterium RIFCSPLOWO2_12_FULL_44_17]|uniref:Uncharacterized protein n=1 Tax=Candidatus Danuiimicrobium aquiferis TaxID=1801832 RepID=A0A1G1KX75_9BACT|nr:MAG: hypothetical protein A3B72_03690 [Omnitrophica bacterium RIFCSPHIGHO2_02_FULL_45_28]OGW90311.1 MAG: hypothetical protein A3E74_01325 [Omnitrophica bacterium RIFCSPHIGHO2_12_FULL_44_12]OGW97199.1 MAG: hypothetical protein A3G33_08470 [Omnitrophica bacterium RIFCSPLOWO2_12_FULL_44_17]OGX02255.1 MAG: hypothetical protein A3J12_08260 [Omnitrophica bacterium RIFCSPLOWO2_02_FULL_44_11]
MFMRWFENVGESEAQRATRIYRLKKRIESLYMKLSTASENEHLSLSCSILKGEIFKFIEKNRPGEKLGQLLLKVSDELSGIECSPFFEKLESNLCLLLKYLKGETAIAYRPKERRYRVSRIYLPNGFSSLRMAQASLISFRKGNRW